IDRPCFRSPSRDHSTRARSLRVRSRRGGNDDSALPKTRHRCGVPRGKVRCPMAGPPAGRRPARGDESGAGRRTSRGGRADGGFLRGLGAGVESGFALALDRASRILARRSGMSRKIFLWRRDGAEPETLVLDGRAREWSVSYGGSNSSAAGVPLPDWALSILL